MSTVTCEIWNDAPELALPEDPAIFFSLRKLWVAYEITSHNDRYAVICFEGIVDFHLTPINDEGLGRHPYAKAGLKWYSFNELFNSAETLKWSSSRHWVITFKDCTLDVVAMGDADPISAKRPGHCFVGKLATVVATDLPANSPADALSRVFQKMAHKPSNIHYATGEIAQIGDYVDDNGQEAIVEDVALTVQAATDMGANEPGLTLRWSIGLPVYRPVTSKMWGGIKFLRRRE